MFNRAWSDKPDGIFWYGQILFLSVTYFYIKLNYIIKKQFHKECRENTLFLFCNMRYSLVTWKQFILGMIVICFISMCLIRSDYHIPNNVSEYLLLHVIWAVLYVCVYIYIYICKLATPLFLLQFRRSGFHPWVGKIPWRKERLSTPVSWPGEFHVLYSPRGREESDMTRQLSLSLFL